VGGVLEVEVEVEVESGKWKVESGKWKVESGKWKVEVKWIGVDYVGWDSSYPPTLLPKRAVSYSHSLRLYIMNVIVHVLVHGWTSLELLTHLPSDTDILFFL